jgi:uncharacterized Zn-binding protein involved in type VI secretion
MPFAARITDLTAHSGVVGGTGVINVLIGGQPAAVAGNPALCFHLCGLPTPHPPGPFVKGSATVLIGGLPALRMGDLSCCGATVVSGAPTVLIGG